MNKQIRVMVTGVGGGGNGEQLLKALRMSTLDYHIIGADMTPLSKGLYAADERVILPPASDPNYLEELKLICRELQVDALFTGSEPELKVISKVQDELRADGIFLPMNKREVIETCLDKSKTMHFLHQNGFHMPVSYTVRSLEDLDAITHFPATPLPRCRYRN